MNKVEKLKARLRNMRETTKEVATNALHSSETLAVGSGIAYLEGRISTPADERAFLRQLVEQAKEK